MKRNLFLEQNFNFPRLSKLMALPLSFVLFATSCKKSDVKMPSEDNIMENQKLEATNCVIEASSSDEENFDMVMGTGEFAESTTSSAATASGAIPGVTITWSPSSSKKVFPRTKTTDYGTGYTAPNGITRAGKVIVTLYDPAKDSAQRMSYTTYDNYVENGVQKRGSIEIRKTKNPAGADVYVHIIHSTVLDTKGNSMTHDDNFEWTVINWNGGINNAYEITGNTHGNETYNGVEVHNFNTHTDPKNPVIRPKTCKRVKGGVIAKIHLAKTPGKPLDEYLDYGNGECDNVATLKINDGQPQVVKIPLQFWPFNL